MDLLKLLEIIGHVKNASEKDGRSNGSSKSNGKRKLERKLLWKVDDVVLVLSCDFKGPLFFRFIDIAG
jgi:hypothetical protein